MKILTLGVASAVCAYATIGNLFGMELWFFIASMVFGALAVLIGMLEIFSE